MMFNASIKRTGLALVLLGAFGSAVQVLGAEINEKQRQALNNFQHELSECAMFYSVSEEGLKKNGSPSALETSKRSGQLKNQMIELAMMIGQVTGMNQKAMQARFQMSFKGMMDEMNDNFVNYSILLQKHAVPCAQLINDSSKRLADAMSQ
jgi:hypothetical protein